MWRAFVNLTGNAEERAPRAADRGPFLNPFVREFVTPLGLGGLVITGVSPEAPEKARVHSYPSLDGLHRPLSLNTPPGTTVRRSLHPSRAVPSRPVPKVPSRRSLHRSRAVPQVGRALKADSLEISGGHLPRGQGLNARNDQTPRLVPWSVVSSRRHPRRGCQPLVRRSGLKRS